jgi:hypothetical protein
LKRPDSTVGRPRLPGNGDPANETRTARLVRRGLEARQGGEGRFSKSASLYAAQVVDHAGASGGKISSRMLGCSRPW